MGNAGLVYRLLPYPYADPQQHRYSQEADGISGGVEGRKEAPVEAKHGQLRSPERQSIELLGEPLVALREQGGLVGREPGDLTSMQRKAVL